MVVKFFSNKKGGSAKAINYLLNHREQEGTARVLQGDPELTRQIINNIKFKQKTTVGCLSFEEKNISEEMKHQLIQDFEKHLLPGMQDRYNILWVEHIDKGRLELNFVIPKIDLVSQKSLNPYYHKADLPRVEKWQDLQNLKYEFSNPKDPSKERNVEINSHIKKFNESYEQLNENIQELVQKGQLQNREQLIELLKNSGIEVTRTGKDYISVKMPDSKKARKFKGGIYEQQFTSIAEIENISQRAEQRVKEYNNRDTQAEQQRLVRELESYTQTKQRELRQKYSTAIREPNKVAQNKTQENRNYDRGQAREGEQSKSNSNSNNNIHNNSSIDSRGNDVSSDQTTEQRRFNDLLHDKRVKNDSFRTTTDERIGTRESIKYRDYNTARRTRNELLESIRQSCERIPNSLRAEQERIIELTGRAKQLAQGNVIHQQIDNKFTKLRSFGNGLKKAIDSTRELIKNRFNKIVEYYNKKFHYDNEILFKSAKALQKKDGEVTIKDVKELEKTFNNEKARDLIKYHQKQLKLKEIEKTLDEIKIDEIKIDTKTKHQQSDKQEQQDWGLHR